MGNPSAKPSEMCSVVAFYGFKLDPVSSSHFYHTVVDWFTHLGFPPDRLGVTAPGYGRKKGAIKRKDAKLRVTGFNDVVDFEITSSSPDTSGGRFHFTSLFSGEQGYDYACIVARSMLATLSSTSFLPIARILANSLKPAYGMGFNMPDALGPEFYCIGLTYNRGAIEDDEEYEAARTICRWGDTAMEEEVWRMGLLRDVYPWNFLTTPHLIRRIGRVTLGNWIQQDSKRGTLSPFCEGIFHWEVDEAQLTDVRQELHKAGAIFDWRKFA